MTTNFDKDLTSIQMARDLVKNAKIAQRCFEQADQETVDKTVAHIADKLYQNAEMLAQLAHDETGYGNVKDKTFKNQFASKNVYESIKGMKTRGIIKIDEDKKLWEIGVAMGVIVGLVPSTNPTSTAIYKALISLKSGNAIVFSPHPAAVGCIGKTVELIGDALEESGHSRKLVSMLALPTMQGTDTLMKHEDVSMILATGGKAMVKAAYSSGTPALGVGPGNVPAFIEKSADIPKAVSMILSSKEFDGGVICASEQAVVVEEGMDDCVLAEFKRQGAYIANDKEKQALERVIANKFGTLNAKIVGKRPHEIAMMAGLEIPESTRVLIAHETGVGPEYPFSLEKLSPLLAFYVQKDWEDACLKCIELLDFGGIGHSLAIHSQNMDIIREFALKKPVSRILVNTPSTQGAIGATTGLAPALTLGCGAVGGSATSDNVTPLNLINIRRVAFGLPQYDAQFESSNTACPGTSSPTTNNDIEEIVRRVLAQLKQ